MLKFSLPENILQPLFSVSNSSTLDETLELLIEASKTPGGRLDLGSKNILPVVLQLSQSLSYPSGRDILLLSLKLLRNLCAGEMTNQNLFIEQNGVKAVSTILLSFVGLDSDSDYGIIRMGLQLLGNVSLAGERHQRAVWHHFFPAGFLEIARVRTLETSDPLCMVIYTCFDQSHEFITEICGDQGLPILAEIVRTASTVGFEEDWLKLLLSRICLEESHFPMLFSKLCPVGSSGNYENIEFKVDVFASEQAFLMDIVSEILNEQINKMTVSSDVALCVLGILKKSVGVLDSVSTCKSRFSAGSNAINVLKYSLTILKEICARDGQKSSNEHGSVDVVDLLVSSGLLELLLCLLRDLEPPAIIRKAIKQGENQDGAASYSPKHYPYRGFRRDLVAVIGNCAYRRKHVQNEIRERNGILLLLQQCVTDEENQFLREWGIWCVRNLLEGNVENQRVVAELELQGSVDVPEIAGLGLRVEVDQKTGRAKLVNVS